MAARNQLMPTMDRKQCTFTHSKTYERCNNKCVQGFDFCSTHKLLQKKKEQTAKDREIKQRQNAKSQEMMAKKLELENQFETIYGPELQNMIAAMVESAEQRIEALKNHIATTETSLRAQVGQLKNKFRIDRDREVQHLLMQWINGNMSTTMYPLLHNDPFVMGAAPVLGHAPAPKRRRAEIQEGDDEDAIVHELENGGRIKEFGDDEAMEDNREEDEMSQ